MSHVPVFCLTYVLKGFRWSHGQIAVPYKKLSLTHQQRRGCVTCHRRNYTAIFEGIKSTTALMRGEGVLLTLIGHGDLQIPAALNTTVAKRVGLNYMARLKTVLFQQEACHVNVALCTDLEPHEM